MLALTTAGAPANAQAANPETVKLERPAARPMVLAYYYPWYKKGDWSRHGYVGTPLLGKYGTDEPEVAKQHIDWAHEGGIDAFVVSWWGPKHMAARHMKAGLLKAPNIDKIRFTFIYESFGRLDAADGERDSHIDFAKPAVLKQFTDDMAHLSDTYFSHPSYLKMKGRPVVVIYLTRTFQNFERKHIEKMQKAIGVDLHLIADEAFIHAQSDPKTARNVFDDKGQPLFDAYTAYNMFEDANVHEGESAQAFMQREAKPVFEKWAAATIFHPHVMPSYHDFRGHKVLSGGVKGWLKQLDDAKNLPMPKGAQSQRMIFITSFNEWWEGTTIEPAQEYGSSYLKSLRRWVDLPINPSP